MVMVMPVHMTARRAGPGMKNLGDPLRGRAFRSNLRFAPISTAIPVASIRFAHSALRLAGGSLRSPPLPADVLVAQFSGVAAVTAVHSSRPRCAPRSSRCSPRSPSPAGARSGHRLGSSRRHSVHRAMHSCPHKCGPSCGHRRRCLRHRAAHDPEQHPLHFAPLKRRGGSDEPPSPAPISPSLSFGFVAISTPFGVSGSHPTHLRCRCCRDCPCPRLADYAPLIGACVGAWRAGNTCHRSVLATEPRLRRGGRSIAPMPRRAPFGIFPCYSRFSGDSLQAPIGAVCWKA